MVLIFFHIVTLYFTTFTSNEKSLTTKLYCTQKVVQKILDAVHSSASISLIYH